MKAFIAGMLMAAFMAGAAWATCSFIDSLQYNKFEAVREAQRTGQYPKRLLNDWEVAAETHLCSDRQTVEVIASAGQCIDSGRMIQYGHQAVNHCVGESIINICPSRGPL